MSEYNYDETYFNDREPAEAGGRFPYTGEPQYGYYPGTDFFDQWHLQQEHYDEYRAEWSHTYTNSAEEYRFNNPHPEQSYPPRWMPGHVEELDSNVEPIQQSVEPTGNPAVPRDDELEKALAGYDRRSDAYLDRHRPRGKNQVPQSEKRSMQQPKENTTKWEVGVLRKFMDLNPVEIPRTMSFKDLLMVAQYPNKSWFDLATTEDRVFVEFDIPASARLCKYHFAKPPKPKARGVKIGCSNGDSCRYLHNPLKMNLVQLALIPDLSTPDKLVARHVDRMVKSGAWTEQSPAQIVALADELRVRRKAARGARVLSDDKYEGIEWYAPPLSRPVREDDGKPGRGFANAEKRKSENPDRKKRQKLNGDVEKEPTKNENPRLVLDLTILSNGEKFRRFLHVCCMQRKATPEEQAEATAAVRAVQTACLDVRHPYFDGAKKTWKEILEIKNLFFKDERKRTTDNDGAIAAVLDEAGFKQQLLELFLKHGLALPGKEEAVVEPPASTEGAATDVAAVPASTAQAAKPKKSKKKKDPNREKGPAQTPATKSGASYLPSDTNKFAIYEDSPTADLNDMPLEQVLAGVKVNSPTLGPVQEDEADGLVGFQAPKVSSRLKNLSRRRVETPGYTEQQREAMRAHDAASDGAPPS